MFTAQAGGVWKFPTGHDTRLHTYTIDLVAMAAEKGMQVTQYLLQLSPDVYCGYLFGKEIMCGSKSSGDPVSSQIDQQHWSHDRSSLVLAYIIPDLCFPDKELSTLF